MGNYIYRNQLVRGSRYIQTFYRPQTKLREGYGFKGVCDSVRGGGHAWLLGGDGVHGCLGGHAWLLLGGVCGCSRGACVVAPRGGMHGCSLGGHAWLLLGGHVWLLLGGHAWLLPGGMHGCSQGGMCGIRRDTEIRSMSGRYASYWNAF